MRILFAFAALFIGHSAFAACEFEIEVGDALTFSVSEMEVEASCKEVSVKLTHTGKMPTAAMGHNWVLSKSSEYQAVAGAGVAAGVEGNYLPSDDARVIASTKLIGGGESDSVTFSIADLDAAESYTFYCSFPGHWAVMKGSFKIV
ncbi:MAG: azurin [Pseudomonadota bacterium]